MIEQAIFWHYILQIYCEINNSTITLHWDVRLPASWPPLIHNNATMHALPLDSESREVEQNDQSACLADHHGLISGLLAHMLKQL